MRILFVTDNFPPEVNAPASRTYEHARRWVEEGVSVTVLTGAPNFPKGKVHAGYQNKWRHIENVDGIRVVRVKTYIATNAGFGRRTLDYLSFMFSAWFFGLFERRPDVIVGTSPQFFTAIAAYGLSICKWRPFVFELRDLWPASIVTVGAMKESLAIRMLEKLELFLYRRSSAIVSVTASFKADLKGRGIDAGKIFVVRNGVDLSRYSPLVANEDYRRKIDVENKFTVAYLGTHGLAHDLENVLEAAKILASVDDIQFLLVGDGARKSHLVERAQTEKIANVIFRDSVPKEQMPDLWSICDVALVHLKDDPVFATVIPSKIFEAFGTGKPILLVQPQGEAAEILASAGAGEWVPPAAPGELASRILKLHRSSELRAHYAGAAVEAAQDHSRDKLAQNMLDVLTTAAR